MKKYCEKIILILILTINIVGLFLVLFNSEPSINEIYAQNIQKVVEIKVDFDGVVAYGTGAVVKSDGTILTNRHVVQKSTSLEVANHVYVRFVNDKNYREAQILKISEKDDLALLKIDAKCQSFSIKAKWNVGQIVYTIGNPSNFGLSFSSGVISSEVRNVVLEEISRRVMQISMVANEGNSGGPIFNEFGELLGIVSFRVRDNSGDIIQGIVFAVPSDSIIDFLIF